MMRAQIMRVAILVPLLFSGSLAVPTKSQYPPKCRFAMDYTQEDILEDPKDFISDLMYWEGKFHANNIGYNTANGMSYDGTLLDFTTGLPTRKNPFSAASKESLQIMLYAHAISGSHEAAQFLSPSNPHKAPKIAAGILETKLKTYLKFNETFPGFGGFIPWFTATANEITPTPDWINRVPGLDNGELLWAVYSVIQALECSPDKSHHQLASNWQQWLSYVKITATKLFYAGKGMVCAVTTIENQTYSVNDPRQIYSCEGPDRLDDPYEGELITWWLYFFGGLSSDDKELLWQVKRPKLQSVEYNMDGVGPITVQKGMRYADPNTTADRGTGFWFSSHEPWKVLEMPYYDVKIIKDVYKNAERVRTCNSVITKNPGMFASVNNSTDPVTGEIQGYVSNAGIPSISYQTVQELDIVTPYSVFPVVLFSKEIGLAWWKNIVDGKKMQNPFGSTEAARIDGTAISSFVSWDSKITTVIALLGGVVDLVRERMKSDGIYDEFVKIANREYSLVFQNLKGTDVELCLPTSTIPDKGLVDYEGCN